MHHQVFLLLFAVMLCVHVLIKVLFVVSTNSCNDLMINFGHPSVHISLFGFCFLKQSDESRIDLHQITLIVI